MDLIEIYQRLFLLEFKHNSEMHDGPFKMKECDCADTISALRIEYEFAVNPDDSKPRQKL